MALTAQRFSGQATLEACAAGAQQLRAGAGDSDAVVRVQRALYDLGYEPGTLDGIFGERTGLAVSDFKRHRGLQPTDPVVGTGTTGALDAYFAPEPVSRLTVDDDAEDPGVRAQLEVDRQTGVDRLLQASSAASVNPGDGTPLRAALDRCFRTADLDTGSLVYLLAYTVRPALDAAAEAWTSGFIRFSPTPLQALTQFYGSPVRPFMFGIGNHGNVHPSALTTMAADERVRAFQRWGLMVSVSIGTRGASPGTPKFDVDPFVVAQANVNAYLAFAEQLVLGGPTQFRPDPVWYV
jgi:peptidoglycan hydrolase-like protein with peptidoglycan-binding domain